MGAMGDVCKFCIQISIARLDFAQLGLRVQDGLGFGVYCAAGFGPGRVLLACGM